MFYFRKRKNAVQARKKLCVVYGEDCLAERQCQRWFARFRSGNFSSQKTAHTGTITADDNKIKAFETNARMTTREMAEKPHILNSTLYLHSQQFIYVDKLTRGRVLVYPRASSDGGLEVIRYVD